LPFGHDDFTVVAALAIELKANAAMMITTKLSMNLRILPPLWVVGLGASLLQREKERTPRPNSLGRLGGVFQKERLEPSNELVRERSH
jgi:hypothetical protein